jgi:hypothetical protein
MIMIGEMKALRKEYNEKFLNVDSLYIIFFSEALCPRKGD